jgi:hypothetical protein
MRQARETFTHTLDKHCSCSQLFLTPSVLNYACLGTYSAPLISEGGYTVLATFRGSLAFVLLHCISCQLMGIMGDPT